MWNISLLLAGVEAASPYVGVATHTNTKRSCNNANTDRSLSTSASRGAVVSKNDTFLFFFIIASSFTSGADSAFFVFDSLTFNSVCFPLQHDDELVTHPLVSHPVEMKCLPTHLSAQTQRERTNKQRDLEASRTGQLTRSHCCFFVEFLSTSPLAHHQIQPGGTRGEIVTVQLQHWTAVATHTPA